MKAAIIDLGTNTFNLAVGERISGKLQLLRTDSIGVGLGKGGIQLGIITRDAEHRAMQALAELQQKAQEAGAQQLMAIGTSAMRMARNAIELQNRCLQELGFPIQIIDGMREAEYIFEGVKASGALNEHSDYLLMDIGGGSVEFIHSQAAKAVWKISLEIGMARLNELFPMNDLPEAALLEEAKDWLWQQLDPLNNYLQNLNHIQLCGSAGSFDTLVALQNQGPSQQTVNLLQKSVFDLWHTRLLQMPRQERAALPGMKPIRVDMMVYAMLLIKLVNDAIGAGNISTSAWSLREGALIRLLQNMHEPNYTAPI
ncbi:MAG: phosphatase [Bacteroidia bacterium]